MDLARVLVYLYPDLAGWEVINNEITVFPEGVPMPTEAELEAGRQLVLADSAKREQAETLQELSEDNARQIPGWAKWSEQQALDYIDGNVTDLQSAKVVIKAMARMILALRDKNFPNIAVED